MFIMRRSLPPYPSSTTCLSGISFVVLALFLVRSPRPAGPQPRDALRLALPHRRRGSRDEHDRAHLEEQRRRLAEEGLPLRILNNFAARGCPVVEIAVRPEVHDLVELGDLGLPGADILGVLLAHRHDRLEVAEPLPCLAHLAPIRPEL